jgi:hypothetical protein
LALWQDFSRQGVSGFLDSPTQMLAYKTALKEAAKGRNRFFLKKKTKLEG